MNRTPETVALMLRVADEIEQHPEQYNQKDWKVPWVGGGCLTAYCIGGWACHLTSNAEPAAGVEVEPVARRLLGLSYDEADRLFDACWEPREGLSVSDALREIAGGASVEFVSWEDG